VLRQTGNLPAEVSSFVNRRGERAEIKRLLALSRLVTVTGVGGVGKTRTALRVATEVRRSFSDGVWWVELSALRQPDLLAVAVANVLGLQDHTRQQLDVLADFVAERRLLLVLDTCEHLLNPCAALVDALLRAGPRLRVLATSRQPLGVAGEHTYSVPPLSTPDLGSGGVVHDHGVELFVERARAVDAGFALTPDNQQAVALLCGRLDGIPLAIELAAGRLRALSVGQLLEYLDDRFRLLTGGNRVGLPRHATMQTAIEWSYQLCTGTEQLLWARISVFIGDFVLGAAERVCADEELPVDAVLDAVAGLVDKSILLREVYPSGVRYRLLNTVREYGQERLRELGKERLLRARHAAYYLELARHFDAEWCGPEQVAWYERLNREHPNLRLALDFCLAEPDHHRTGLELAGRLRFYWFCCGVLPEGRHYLDRLLALKLEPGPALTTATWVSAWVALGRGDLAAICVRLAECRGYAQAQGDIAATGFAAYIAGSAAMLRGDQAQALALAEESADLHRQGGDPGMGLMLAYGGQSMALALAGQFRRAIVVTEELRAVCDEYGERWMRSYADYIRAVAELAGGNPEAASGYARDALRLKSALRDCLGVVLAIDVLSLAAVELDDAERAARLLGISYELWGMLGLPQFGAPDLVAARQRCEREAYEALGDRGYHHAFEAGRNLDPDAAIAYALGERQQRRRGPSRERAAWAPLTRRERQIAELVAEGRTNQEIANRLVISKRTVDSHVEHSLAKLGFATRAQIAAWVTEQRAEPSDESAPVEQRR
jgi:non-specific serine/threonine protein kinase